MRRVQGFRKSKSAYFMIILAFTIGFLSLINCHSLPNEIKLQNLLTRVTASLEVPSFSPIATRSGSGRMHLIFLHETQISDVTSDKPYHTYELPNGGWSQPKKVIDDHFPTFFTLIAKENGLIIYYSNDKGIEDSGIYKREFEEQVNEWTEPERLFGFSQIKEYLNLNQTENPIDYFRWGINAFFLSANETFFVAWGFYSHNTSIFNHAYENHCIISQHTLNGSWLSQPIQGLGPDYNPVSWDHRTFNFFKNSDSLFLYSAPFFTYRTLLFPNGSWSQWESSNITTGFESIVGNIRISVVDESFVIYHAKDENGFTNWGMVELTQANLTTKLLNLPHKLTATSTNGGIALKLMMNDEITPMFMTAFITNHTIELWTFNYANESWSQLSSLEYSVTESYNIHYIPFYSELFDIELIYDGSNWRVFWDQQVGTKRLFEIFTVTYNPITDEWSSVTQVTETHRITDDYSDENTTPGFSSLIGFLGLIMTLLLLRKKSLNLKMR
ncbi:MAG: hypothetical protein ACFFAU_19125 [Candidatus Hodarchaeota archaeon]